MSQNVLPEATVGELIMWLLRRRQRLRVVGESMLPLLCPGEEVLVDIYAYSKASPKIGDVVVITHPIQKGLTIVKRITAISDRQTYFVVGDNPEASTDSRHWGTVKLASIIGRVTSKFN
ncbi:MAG: nickel-type superoxide dismutase maturation protease [Cyanobacteria bacterium P01_C01_bin.72]